jgi:hypothetical protein
VTLKWVALQEVLALQVRMVRAIFGKFQVTGSAVEWRLKALELALGAPDQEKSLSTEIIRILKRTNLP